MASAPLSHGHSGRSECSNAEYWQYAMEASPYFSETSFIFSAMVSSASSQLICSKWPLPAPRPPTRFIGCSTRSSAYSSWRHAWPIGQPRIWIMPWASASSETSSRPLLGLTESSGSIETTLLSFTPTFMMQLASQHPLFTHVV